MRSLIPKDKNGERVSDDNSDCFECEDRDEEDGDCLCHVVAVFFLETTGECQFRSVYSALKVNELRIN